MSCSRNCQCCFIPHTKERSSLRSSESDPELCSFVSSEQLMTHVLVYAEVLFRWKLLHKRIELLKAVDPFLRPPSDPSFNLDHSQLGTCFPPLHIRACRRNHLGSRLGVSFLCTQCGEPTTSRTQSACSACGVRRGMPRCSVCRLPVKGMSFLLFNDDVLLRC